MKIKLFLAALSMSSFAVHAQSPEAGVFAEPALRSPVVGVEFTGQRCRYCPNMARALKANQDHYGADNYIITALHHLPSFSLIGGRHVSLYNEEAVAYATSIDIHSGVPQLVYNTLGPTVSDLTLDQKFQEPDLLECVGAVKIVDNSYDIQLQTRLRSDRQEFMKGKNIDIVIWALENDIVALQDDNGRWTYPKHQHIFRGSVNTTWGEPYEIGTPYHKSFAVPAAVSVVGNTDLVVFFIDHVTRTVYDAAQLHLISTHESQNLGGAMATFSSEYPSTPSIDGVRAFFATSQNNNGNLQLKEIKPSANGKLVVPAHTGVVLQTTSPQIFNMIKCEGEEELTGNLLTPTGMKSVDVPVEENVFILGEVDGQTAFYRLSSEERNIKAYHAYLSLPSSTNIDCLNISFDETTGIEDVIAAGDTDDSIYDLSGRVVNRPLKSGVYIQHGKKFIVK